MSDAAAEVVPDPFATQTHVPHPALSRNEPCDSEHDPTLFDRFFASPAFCAWSSGTRSWQLHCYGEPGCGKTTVAAFAANRLPSHINGIRTAVASISITQHVWSTSLDFVEDLFQLIHSAFGAESNADYEKYQRACHSGKPGTERIQRLIAALSSARSKTCKFLILDGYDRVNEALQSVIDAHFSALQLSGLKVMTTRRVPVFSIAFDRRCDRCDQPYLELWWECPKCNVFDLCYDCEKKDVLGIIHKCQVTSLRETYQHVSIKLGDFPVERLIEKRLIMHYRIELETTKQIVAYISSKSGGNITLALLYLEDVFARDDVSTFNMDRVDDRLPRDVIAYFDTEMNFIENRPEPQRLPPLFAIAAAADYPNGIPLRKLEECIRLAQGACSNFDYPRSVEDVFTAANGWLTNPHTKDREVDICCKPAFTLYAREGYNNLLAKARRQIRSSAKRESGAVTSEQLRELPSSLETPDLLGNTFDTLESGTSLRTPLRSIDNGLDIYELKGKLDRPLFLSEGEKLVQSPPRQYSIENVPKSSLAVSPDEELNHHIARTGMSSHPSVRRVCDFCVSNILESNESSGTHRISIDGAKAVKDNCTFCSSLYADIYDIANPSNDDDWPLYHWTLRALPRGRELKGSMMLRFWSCEPTLATKSFRLLPGSDLYVPSPKILHDSTDPKESGGTQIKKWMEACMRDHQGCSEMWHHQRSNPFFLPTRLIDVDTGDDSIVRLIDTKLTKAKGSYCTLSHAWGPSEELWYTTTVWNMAKHLIAGIKLDELPPNFQQAIQVTRFLNVRYIWIDSLAIVQKPYGDFAEEADLMHKVYRYSFCNIVAADSRDGYGGLFRRRTPNEVLPVEYRGTGANHHLGERTWAVVPADLWERELLSSAIYSRGWVFQERILSPRLLHFTKYQIFWDCATLSACEVFPNGLPFPLDHHASTDRHWRGRLVQSTVPTNALSGVNDNESSYTFWTSAVQNYTECVLTNQGDKTIAIWSIAKLLRDFMGEEYAVGMWSHFLEEQMAWIVRNSGGNERPPELQIKIPSWSWASVKGPVVPQHRLALRSYQVKDHTGANVKFIIEKKTREGDKEPVLESKALALKANVNTGRLKILLDGSYSLQVSFESSGATFEMDAFPDTSLATTGINSKQCKFMILAASAISHNTCGSQSTQPSSPEAFQTYSGIGLLLTTQSAWFIHQEQLYQECKSALSSVKPTRQQEWRIAAFEKLVLEQQKKAVKTNEELEPVYRRVGALQFRDMHQQAFSSLTDNRRLRDIWLE